jgi:hypothetical protein
MASGPDLLFAPGRRPSRADLAGFLSRQERVQLSHDPAAAPGAAEADGEIWLELLRDGLTFDLRGLAPGPSGARPEIVHRFDYPATAATAEAEVVSLRPGPHLAGGAGSAPVLRAMLALARDLTRHFADLVAVFWPPSRSAIGRTFFESVVTAWLEGGAFPALGLTAFEETSDGALQTIGLALWIGQELLIEPKLAADKIAATRLGVRLINHLVILGGLNASERILAPDGSSLMMEISPDSRWIRVRRD